MSKGLNLKLYRVQNGIKASDVVAVLRTEGIKISNGKLSNMEADKLPLPDKLEVKIRMTIDKLRLEAKK